MEIMDSAGHRIYQFAASIFPFCRSITGNGVRLTLEAVSNYISAEDGLKLTIHEILSGTPVFDWIVPKEWVIRDAYIENNEKHIVDMKDNNLHVVGYSTPVDRWVSLDELKKYIFTQPDQPEVIPYVTSYYRERYGFCMSDTQMNSLPEGKYHMYIDSELVDGSLTYADLILPGSSEEEILMSSYICHPSMANNECSGPALLAEIIRYIYSLKKRKYTYRFVFNPETIGSIVYLNKNYKHLQKKLVAGVVLSCVGDDRDYSIIESRYANTLADKSMKNILHYHTRYTTYTYLERGSDERQYNAPGIDLPVVGFSRTKYGAYPEYHTSADDMGLVSPSGFQGSYEVMVRWIQAMEHNEKYHVTVLCEPQLGKRGLYPTISRKGQYNEVKAMTDFIAYADGRNDLFDISNITGVSVEALIPIARKLENNGLIRRSNVNYKEKALDRKDV